MKNILLIGKGEVGSAIKQIEKEAGNNIYIQEIDNEAPELIYDVCHVNITYSDKFINIVTEYLNKYKPELTIINSTVKLGTTNFLKRTLGIPIVHSPVCGVHPKLYEGLKTFKKFVGGKTEYAISACEHFTSIGIKPYHCGNSNHSEMAKLLSTTYYGLNILFAKMVNEICNNNELDYNEVYIKFNENYNKGYTELNMKHVVRPILRPPTDKIGGHCISENFEFLPDNSDLKFVCKFLNGKKNSEIQKIHNFMKVGTSMIYKLKGEKNEKKKHFD